MKSTSLLSLTALGFALVGAASSRAGTIDAGAYTINYTNTGDGAMTINLPTGFSNNLVSFSHDHFTGADTNTWADTTGSMTATFQAAPGKIFDKIYWDGINGGNIFNQGTSVRADFQWTVNGGTFTGPETYGGTDSGDGAFIREWAITGPNSGRSRLYSNVPFRSLFFDFGGEVPGSGYYDIGAASFSIDMTAYVAVNRWGDQWPGAIDPQGNSFGISMLDAPPPVGVPEGASTAGLMLLALAGMVSVRRFLR